MNRQPPYALYWATFHVDPGQLDRAALRGEQHLLFESQLRAAFESLLESVRETRVDNPDMVPMPPVGAIVLQVPPASGGCGEDIMDVAVVQHLSLWDEAIALRDKHYPSNWLPPPQGRLMDAQA